jgi:hypothetical protein
MDRRMAEGSSAIPRRWYGVLADAGTSPATLGAWRDDPELRLRAAVLQEAIDTILRGPESGPRSFLDAQRWVLMDDELWPFSFVRICDALDLEPEHLRKRLASELAMVARPPRPSRFLFLTTHARSPVLA